jgi:hypothetical protein
MAARDAMTISDLIQDEIEDFRAQNDGRDPKVLKLGRSQVAALDSFGQRYASGEVAPKDRLGVPNFEGIPIEKVDADHWLAAEGDEDPD